MLSKARNDNNEKMQFYNTVSCECPVRFIYDLSAKLLAKKLRDKCDSSTT